ncbi:MAG TPA: nitrate- and nitrite sensing domain-containing protein, partial [Pseudonocardiaceae bacterium]
MKIRSENRKAQRSIAGRLTGAVLIPSVVLLVMWLAVSAYLLYDGFYARAVASSVRQVSIPAVNGLASAQRERQLSMAYLGQPSVGLDGLHAQEKQTDDGLAAMKIAATATLGNAPQAIVNGFNAVNGYLNQLPGIRAQVDARTIGVNQVYTFYNSLLDSATNLFDTQARIVPDVNAAQGGIEATSLFRATDEESRASSLISTALVTGNLSAQDHLAFVSLVGAYHGELGKTVSFLEPDVASAYQQLQTTSAWQNLVTVENGFIERGAWSHGGSALPSTAGDWETLTNQVAAQLTKLSKQQADEVSAQALSNGNSTFVGVAVGSLIALLAAIAAIVVARRVSRTLVDRTLVTRLARLRDEALEL